ncbi:MAG TPA: SDR family NAD(P)-dependent oxidoreductase [Polyangiaceae bacterium]|nr:SDR family NAD(P)-dependent oxidoreductase [Polyangiaceae bacterium]
MSKPVCVVVGVGPGNGAALAQRFHDEGYAVALLARSSELSAELAQRLGDARAYVCDVADEAAVADTFAAIARELGPVEVLLYNAGVGVWGNIEDVSAKDFEQSWRVNTLGAFLTAKQVVGPMKQAGHGQIVFIGATASRRGNVKTAAFAPAKAAQRSLAESMARYLWPAGVHVAVVILDGVVDLPRTRQMMPGKPDDFFVKPSELAESVWQLTRQPRSAWSFELEARPFGESW